MIINRKNYVFFMVLLVSVLLLALPLSPLAFGQDDWNAQERKPVEQQPAHMLFAVEQNMNQWIFECTSMAQARRKLESKLTLRLNAIESTGGLTQAQIEKLRLAANGDMERFFRKVAKVKKECSGMNINNNDIQKIWEKTQPLQREFKKGIFDEGALFHKVLQGIIRSDPSGAYQKQVLERQKYRHKTMIELSVAALEMGVPLTDSQRQKFIKLLLEETKPPKKYGGQSHYVVFCLASKIDRKKIKPIFDKAQWNAVNQMLRQGKSMERHLKKQGFIP